MAELKWFFIFLSCAALSGAIASAFSRLDPIAERMEVCKSNCYIADKVMRFENNTCTCEKK